MRAQSAVGYVRSKRMVKPSGLDTSPKLYRALARYAYNVTSPNLEKFRHGLDEKRSDRDFDLRCYHSTPCRRMFQNLPP